ncbi:MAG: hypothetical protein HKN68_12485, partial [Saprospiraceae bacterium]|nr:hypothetical protein [Saprospiraceae bacterium]
MKYFSIIVFFCSFLVETFAQSNVRAWQAHGQVWVVWENDQPLSGQFSIFTNPDLSPDLTTWNEIGRLFPELTYPASARRHIGIDDLHYKIPNGNGGTYTLEENEGLFVETIRETKDQYFLIQNCEEGPCNLPVAQSSVSNQVNILFDETSRPKPHLQASTEISLGQFINLFYLWTEGRSDHRDGLPCFPIMGNQHTNGWPHVFAVWNGPNADLSEPAPAIHWLHGGSGNFSQYLPDRRPEINNNSDEGVVVCHNDDFMRYVQGHLVFNESNSWWFGWGKDHNPFDKSHNGPSASDTIINYSQRRIKFINDWLIEQGVVDEHRVAIQGYSVGSAGAVGMVKSFPEIFSSASIFSCGHQGPDDDNFGSLLLGNKELDLPTNLKDRFGNTLHIHDLYDLQTFTSFEDLPLIRSWHGKNDINPTMKWDKEFLDEARYADSIGLGYQLYWDERTHPILEWNTHWTNGPSSSEQTQKDNTAFHERYRNDQSYPVFYNYRLYDIEHIDPGDGSLGTGAIGVGDDWGTWGGYH